MKICTLVENTTIDKKFPIEHGLSLYIETKKHKILFDTGQSDLFYMNAKSMGIHLENVDICILSHGHYDHGGGLETFLKINDHAKIYMNKEVFIPHYNGSEKYIGLNQKLINEKRFIYVDDEYKIDDELTLVTCNQNDYKYPIESYGLNRMSDHTLLPDNFYHEQYLIVKEDKRVVFSGCSHKGILNIMNWLAPDILIGGFHFKKLDIHKKEDCKILEYACKELMNYQTKYYTGHCTGIEKYTFLKERMKEQIDYISTGSIVEL